MKFVLKAKLPYLKGIFKLIMLSLFSKFKRDNFWGPFLKALGGTTKFSIHFYSSEQSLFVRYMKTWNPFSRFFFRLFEIQSSGRSNQLRIIYRALSSSISSSLDGAPSKNHLVPIQAVETLSLNLADNQWHKLAVTFSGNQLQVFLDCQ